jgi:hypothetical protein
VRKYVLIQPAQRGRDWPPFVLFFTDFSPGRAEPLQTGLRTADTRATADAQIAAWIEDNIKKGWNQVGPGGASVAKPADAKPADEPAPATTEGDAAKAPKKRAPKKAKA